MSAAPADMSAGVFSGSYNGGGGGSGGGKGKVGGGRSVPGTPVHGHGLVPPSHYQSFEVQSIARALQSVGSASCSRVAFICFSLLLRECECSCDVYLCSLHSLVLQISRSMSSICNFAHTTECRRRTHRGSDAPSGLAHYMNTKNIIKSHDPYKCDFTPYRAPVLHASWL
jgi:hypothetical protein